MKDKVFKVAFYEKCGMIGTDLILSKHTTAEAAWAALDKYAKDYDKRHLHVINEEGNDVLRVVKVKRLGR